MAPWNGPNKCHRHSKLVQIHGEIIVNPCHPEEVTFPPLPQPIKAGSLVLDVAIPEG